MMTDLTGIELDLAVARVMGRRISTVQPLAGGGVTAGWIDPHKVDAAHCTWHPSRDGAAAWEVLEWVLGQRLHVELWRDRLDGCTVCWILDRTGNGRLVADVIGPADGPTDAIALCRAVVALGEM